ncbi:MAG: hypothetical protein IBJ18_06505 [Phycisphaerales bacterium]|nr:hypothetical protein [Phycisphaerales bacterium]
MPATIDILGVRHHGPGSARMVLAALDKLQPDAVLIEGPPDAHDVLSFASHAEMRPPVALLVYEPDEPSNAAYYPFADFSPEWQAIRWAQRHSAEVRFIDLPWSNRQPDEKKLSESSVVEDDTLDKLDKPDKPGQPQQIRRRIDPLEELAHAAGYEDGEGWWGRLIEEQHHQREQVDKGENALAVFGAIMEAMRAVRATEHVDEADRNDIENARREAHMRRAIRQATKQGFSRIVVVCGAYHAPMLTSDALERVGSKSDDQLLKGLPKRKTAATWIPWTNDRLSMWSGYGAGVVSPGWYGHVWEHADQPAVPWMTRVARLLREEDIDASPAHVIESARLAQTLASLRGRSMVGLNELTEATLSVMCGANPLPLKVIERKLIVGVCLGSTPDETPAVPLQRDLAARQKALRLKPSADDTLLDLDQRKETDLERSRLLHRLCILNVEWGLRQQSAVKSTGTFHEVWKLQWKPELAVKIVEAARWGNTVLEAAQRKVLNDARRSSNLEQLTILLDHVLLADLAGAIEPVIERIQTISAVATDVRHLLDALPPLADVLRYGNVRKTDAALVEPVVTGLLARICAGLGPACGSLDDDAAAAMTRRIDRTQSALTTLDRKDLIEPWYERLRTLGEAAIHPRVAGRCWRILLSAQVLDTADAARHVSLALSVGNDPAFASAWLEGFISGSGLVLVHDRTLLGIIDRWVCSLNGETFDRICPILRRTFSTFEKPERRQIGEALKRSAVEPDSRASSPDAISPVGYDLQRAELVTPILRLILGDPL